jgi:hypothetical protein
MPRPQKTLDQFQAQIELRVASGQTHKEIRSWLATQGVRVSKNTLSTRCVAWSATRRSGTYGGVGNFTQKLFFSQNPRMPYKDCTPV